MGSAAARPTAGQTRHWLRTTRAAAATPPLTEPMPQAVANRCFSARSGGVALRRATTSLGARSPFAPDVPLAGRHHLPDLVVVAQVGREHPRPLAGRERLDRL